MQDSRSADPVMNRKADAQKRTSRFFGYRKAFAAADENIGRKIFGQIAEINKIHAFSNLNAFIRAIWNDRLNRAFKLPACPPRRADDRNHADFIQKGGQADHEIFFAINHRPRPHHVFMPVSIRIEQPRPLLRVLRWRRPAGHVFQREEKTVGFADAYRQAQRMTRHATCFSKRLARAFLLLRQNPPEFKRRARIAHRTNRFNRRSAFRNALIVIPQAAVQRLRIIRQQDAWRARIREDFF